MSAQTQLHDDQATRAEVAAVADTISTLMRSFSKARTQLLAAAAHDVEWSAHVLLKCVANEGPIRASALAGLIRADPSTVSRQVAALVKDGLLERQADPVDGRASLLVTTARAADVLADHDEIRDEHFARMLADWDGRDLRRFAALLHRFTDDFNEHKDAWLPDRLAGQVVAEGKS